MKQEIPDGVYKSIETFQNQNCGLSPTIREIAGSCYLNVSKIVRCIDILQAQGRLIRSPRIARSIRLLTPEKR